MKNPLFLFLLISFFSSKALISEGYHDIEAVHYPDDLKGPKVYFKSQTPLSQTKEKFYDDIRKKDKLQLMLRETRTLAQRHPLWLDQNHEALFFKGLIRKVEEGSLQAQRDLGNFLCKKNFTAMGLDWLRLGVKEGYLPSIDCLGYWLYTTGSIDESWDHLMYAAKRGYADSQFMIGHILCGTPDKRSQGVRWLERAAEQGHYEAMYDLSQNTPDKKKWLAKSAEGGYVKAQYDLGVLLCEESCTAQGLSWLEKAANWGYMKARTKYNYYHKNPQKSEHKRSYRGWRHGK